MAEELPEERARRLEQLRISQQERLAEELPEERARRLERKRLNQQEHQQRGSSISDAHLPLLEQSHVRNKMRKFHEAISTIETPICSTCLEKFPGMRMSTKSAECDRCARDKQLPKLYSAANVMSPGSVPPELQVINFYNIVMILLINFVH